MKTILVAGGVSLLLALLGTPLAIKVFSRRGYGQLIREEGPAAHVTKRGTPTPASSAAWTKWPGPRGSCPPPFPRAGWRC